MESKLAAVAKNVKIGETMSELESINIATSTREHFMCRVCFTIPEEMCFMTCCRSAGVCVLCLNRVLINIDSCCPLCNKPRAVANYYKLKGFGELLNILQRDAINDDVPLA